MKLSAVKTAGEILGGYKTRQVTKTSKRTGKEYQVDVVPMLEVYAVSGVTIMNREDGTTRYKYSVTDPNRDLQYDISAPNKIDTKFGNVIQLHNVTCGVIPNTSRVWVSAESVSLKK